MSLVVLHHVYGVEQRIVAVAEQINHSSVNNILYVGLIFPDTL